MSNLIRKFDDPILKAICEPVEHGSDLSWLQQLKSVARECKSAVGLAAPQIGIAKRACFIWHKRKGGESLLMVNPIIINTTKPTTTENEGCLSYPGVHSPVERSYGVMVEFHDENWCPHLRDFYGFQARVIQHEIDHLDRVCKVGDAWRARPPVDRSSMATIGALLMLTMPR